MKAWHELVKLRDDVRTGELSLAVFAADLNDVVLEQGRRPVYEDPAKFFALTYPTYALRELVKDVMARLAKKSDKAVRQLELTYGGGKTHTLITLRHLVHNPASLPDLPAVKEFEAHIGFKPPKARVAALCFDKLDVEKGMAVRSPDGKTRTLKHPWSILAYQLAGVDGLKHIHADDKDAERETPPAEPLMVDLLSWPEKDGLATLVLIDEVLMYVREKVGLDPVWRGRMIDFFQYLTQAVTKVDSCAMIASLLASDPEKSDQVGKELIGQMFEIFNRQKEEGVQPVQKEDVAEVLRRRFFTPESIRDVSAFKPHVTTAVGNIAALDEQTKKDQKNQEARFQASFPFHPDLTDVFYTRWTQLEGFQRTRGILRTFAIALRDAEKWDTAPLVGSNVFLPPPAKKGISEAARELTGVATREQYEGKTQEWTAILEGELDKARVIQSEVTGLPSRELEQAVVTVFLHSQPAGAKAQTHDVMALVSPAKPDKIQLEKSLIRWANSSWFLDEAEAGLLNDQPGGQPQLPKAWRLGNRPNLKQMHDDACNNRVPSQLVESKLIDEIEKLKALTTGASGAGAKPHNLPQHPKDIEDDGQFHYAVLGPKAASESGKPSAEARRFIDETTASDRPRVNRNAVVLAVPSKEGLDAARVRIREYLGWEAVREQLKDQAIDPIREQTLAMNAEKSRKSIPDAIRQAYCIVVTVDASNSVQAFKVTVSDDPLFSTIKSDKRSRVQDTAISADALLPGGPYDLWRADEKSRRIKDLVGAFARFPKLPKMLQIKEILNTVLQGVKDGIWVAELTRPDRTKKTYWRSAIDDVALQDPGLELFLPESAELTELPPGLLAPKVLPGLWASDEIAVGDVTSYFQGGNKVQVQREGYQDTLVIPKCDVGIVEAAVASAVELGHLWLTSGPASILGDPVPQGVLSGSARICTPPAALSVSDLTEESLPSAWKDGQANALAIMTALSAKVGKTLPWKTVESAIDGALKARWLERAPESGSWPCGVESAQHIVLTKPKGTPPPPPPPSGMLVAEAFLEVAGIQDLADVVSDLTKAAIGQELRFKIRIEYNQGGKPDPDAVSRLNEILEKVTEALKLE